MYPEVQRESVRPNNVNRRKTTFSKQCQTDWISALLIGKWQRCLKGSNQFKQIHDMMGQDEDIIFIRTNHCLWFIFFIVQEYFWKKKGRNVFILPNKFNSILYLRIHLFFHSKCFSLTIRNVSKLCLCVYLHVCATWDYISSANW